MSLRLSDHKVLHNIASSSFFLFRSDFLAFFARISYFKFLEFKEFNKTIIPFALGGNQTGLPLFTISYPTRAHGIIVNYYYHHKFFLLLLLHQSSVFPDDFVSSVFLPQLEDRSIRSQD